MLSRNIVGIIGLLSLFPFTISVVSTEFNASKLVRSELNPSLLRTSRSRSSLGDSGYYDIPGTVGGRMFYYLFENRSPTNSPVVLWLTGVPGLASSISIFHENGPFHIHDDNTLSWTKFGWDKEAKIIYVDEPIGTGFSCVGDDSDIRNNKEDIINDLYNFLQYFFKTYEEYKDNDFFIAGQSYAGKYAPMLAYKIHKDNKIDSNIDINLRGVAIGNGLTNPRKQFDSIPQFCKDRNLLEPEYQSKIESASKKCQKSAKQCEKTRAQCLKAYNVCGKLLHKFSKFTKGRNVYDVKKMSIGVLHYDFSDVKRFFDIEEIRESLGLGNKSFHLLNDKVYDAMRTDYMRNSEKYVAFLVERDINVLIYVGENDLVTNWLGNRNWVTDLIWKGDQEFKESTSIPLLVNNIESGLIRGDGPLKFCRVYKAGHMVAMDRPEVAFQMMTNWMKNAKQTI